MCCAERLSDRPQQQQETETLTGDAFMAGPFRLRFSEGFAKTLATAVVNCASVKTESHGITQIKRLLGLFYLKVKMAWCY